METGLHCSSRPAGALLDRLFTGEATQVHGSLLDLGDCGNRSFNRDQRDFRAVRLSYRHQPGDRADGRDPASAGCASPGAGQLYDLVLIFHS